MITILMMSSKLATPGLLKIKIFRNKDYDVIIPDCDAPIRFYHVTQSLVTLAFI